MEGKWGKEGGNERKDFIRREEHLVCIMFVCAALFQVGMPLYDVVGLKCYEHSD